MLAIAAVGGMALGRTNVRWVAEHGYGSPDEFPEVAVLRSQL